MHKVYGDRFTAEELNLIVNVINLLINGDDSHNRNFTTEEKTKLANLQFHPATHSADIIDETVDRHFMTSAEKTKLSLLSDGSNIDATLLQQVTEVLNMFTWDKSRDLTENKSDSSKWVLKATSDLQTVKDLDSYGHPQDGDGGAVFKTDENNNLFLRRLDEAGNVVYKKVNVNIADLTKDLTEDSPLWGKFARKDISDTFKEVVTFLKGLKSDSTITTLNLVVKSLASIYDLEVSHVATIFQTIIKDSVHSDNFISGFSGEGMKLYKAINGDWNLEIDNLTVRKAFSVFELIITKIRAVNGGLAISQANGKVSKVDTTEDSFVLTIEGDMMFVVDDLARCQHWGASGIKYYWVPIYSVSENKISILKSNFSTSIPEVGDELVQMGNLTNTSRQSLIYLSASEDGKPKISVLDGVNSVSFEGKNKVIIGCLDDISDIDFPSDKQPSGYGLYAINCFLKGMFILSNGETVENEISGVKSSISDISTQLLAIPGQISSAITETKNYTDNKLSNYVSSAVYGQDIEVLKAQIDKSTTSWFYDYNPAPTTIPESDWTTDELKKEHLGDLFYNIESGCSYRYVLYNGAYSWNIITDTNITKALSDASKALDTADSKRRVFVSTPVTPYDVGDLWAQGLDGDLMKCIISRSSSENYVISDWSLASKYTDDTMAKAASDSAKVAYDAASKANDTLLEISSDNKLTTFEKCITLKEWDIIVSEVELNTKQADDFNIITEKLEYLDAYSLLNTYISPLLSDLKVTSDIIGDTFRSKFKAYYNARTLLLNAIATSAKNLAISNAANIYIAKTVYESKIVELSNLISAKVSQYDFNALGQKVEEHESEISIQSDKIETEVSSIRKEFAAKDNLLKNASFSADTLYWLAINEIKLFTVNGKLLSFNRNFYGNKNRTLKVVNDGSRLTIRVKNIGIKQLNENISKPAKVVLADGTTDNPNFYISFQYRCTLAGTLKIGFSGTPLYFEQHLAVTDEYQYLELSGKWDLTGDFTLSFDGDMFLYDLSLRNDKLQDFALLTSSKFTQTDASISAIVKQVNEINNTIANAGWLTEADKVKIWAALTFGETGTTLESLFEVTANGIFLKSNHIDLTGKVSFNSLTTDFQSTYANDLSNAQLAAKNGIAQQLGFTNYAQLVENALVGKTLISGGYINSQLIDAATIITDSLLADKIKTVDIETNKLTAKEGSKLGNLKVTSKGSLIGANHTFEEIKQYNFWADGGVFNAAAYSQFIINNIGNYSTFFLSLDTTGGTYTVYLPTYENIQTAIGNVINIGYGFTIKLIVPGRWVAAGMTTTNNAIFRITSQTNAEIYDNNFAIKSYIDISKGDILELYGVTVIKSTSGTLEKGDFTVTYGVDYYIKSRIQ